MMNVMFDRRVIRGNTYSGQVVAGATVVTSPQQPLSPLSIGMPESMSRSTSFTSPRSDALQYRPAASRCSAVME